MSGSASNKRGTTAKKPQIGSVGTTTPAAEPASKSFTAVGIAPSTSRGVVDPTDGMALTWVEQTTNPIYDPYPGGTDEDYFPCVIYSETAFDGHGDASKYKMWHQGPSGTIAVSYSDDGVNWTLGGVTDLPAGSSYHPAVLYDEGGFGGGAAYYKLWFWTGDSGKTPAVGQCAESTDGLKWTNVQSLTQSTSDIVVGTSPSWFYHFYGPDCVLFNSSPTSTPGQPLSYPYVMYYNTAAEGLGPGSSKSAIGIAFSSDGVNWTRFANRPALLPRGTGVASPSTAALFEWDGGYAAHATIAVDNAGLLHMYYSGGNSNNPDGLDSAQGIGHAVSRDGIQWSRDWSAPVFTVNDATTWRTGRTYAPCVLHGVFDGSSPMWKMWFSGGNGLTVGVSQGIGYATARS